MSGIWGKGASQLDITCTSTSYTRCVWNLDHQLRTFVTPQEAEATVPDVSSRKWASQVIHESLHIT